MLVTALAILVLSSALVALAFPEYGTSGFSESKYRMPEAWKGVFGAKNELARAASLLGILAAGWMVRIRPAANAGARPMALALLLLALIVLWQAQSVTAFAMLIVALLAVVVIGVLHELEVPPFGIAVLLVLLAVAVTLIMTSYLGLVTTAMGRDPTITGRTSIWSEAVAIIAERPLLGHGYEAVWVGIDSRLPRYPTTLRHGHAHNGFLQIAATLGVPAMLASIWFVLSTIWRALIHHAINPNPARRLILAALFVIAIRNLTGTSFFVNQDWEWVAFTVFAVMTGAPVWSQRRRPRRPSNARLVS